MRCASRPCSAPGRGVPRFLLILSASRPPHPVLQVLSSFPFHRWNVWPEGRAEEELRAAPVCAIALPAGPWAPCPPRGGDRTEEGRRQGRHRGEEEEGPRGGMLSGWRESGREAGGSGPPGGSGTQGPPSLVSSSSSRKEETASSAQWNVCKGDKGSSDLHGKHGVGLVTPQFRGALGLQDQGRRGARGCPGGQGGPLGEDSSTGLGRSSWRTWALALPA